MHNKVIPHTLSSRYDLKRANDDCQNLLEHYALPISAIDSMAGASPITSYLDYAYGQLLQIMRTTVSVDVPLMLSIGKC